MTDPTESSQPPVADPDLRAELLARADTDQQVRVEANRRWPGGTLIDTDDPLYARWRQVDEDNTTWLQHIIDTTGWPTIDRVGDDGAQAAWLLALLYSLRRCRIVDGWILDGRRDCRLVG